MWNMGYYLQFAGGETEAEASNQLKVIQLKGEELGFIPLSWLTPER